MDPPWYIWNVSSFEIILLRRLFGTEAALVRQDDKKGSNLSRNCQGDYFAETAKGEEKQNVMKSKVRQMPLTRRQSWKIVVEIISICIENGSFSKSCNLASVPEEKWLLFEENWCGLVDFYSCTYQRTQGIKIQNSEKRKKPKLLKRNKLLNRKILKHSSLLVIILGSEECTSCKRIREFGFEQKLGCLRKIKPYEKKMKSAVGSSLFRKFKISQCFLYQKPS